MNKTIRKNASIGSAMVWVVMLLLVSTILIASILPLAAANLETGRNVATGQQAYLTALSVTDMIVEYLTNNVEEGTGKDLQDKAINAGSTGITWQVSGLAEDMGTCEVTMKYENSCIYVSSTAEYADEVSTVGAILQKEVTVGDMNVSYTLESAKSEEGFIAKSVQATDSLGYFLKNTKNDQKYDIFYTGDQPSEMVCGSAVTPADGILYANGGINDSKVVNCDYVLPIISTKSVIMNQPQNTFHIVPASVYEKAAFRDDFAGEVAVIAQEDIELKGKVGLENPNETDVFVWGKSLTLQGDTYADRRITAQGYTFYSTSDITVKNAALLNKTASDGRVIYNKMMANSQILLEEPSGGGTAEVQGILTCKTFQISGNNESSGTLLVGNVTCDNAAASTGEGIAVVESIQATGDVYLTGKIHVNSIQAGGSVTLDGEEVTVGQVSCKGELIIENDATVGSSSELQHGFTNVFDVLLPLQEGSQMIPQATILPDTASASEAMVLTGSSIDNLQSNKKVHVYKVASSGNIAKLTLDSHGDTYIYIDGVNVSISEIASKVYYGNLYFILDNNASLQLGSATGNPMAMRLNVIDLAHAQGNTLKESTLRIRRGVQITGMLDVATVQFDDSVEYIYNIPDEITGSFNKEYARWRLVQYTGKEQ